MLEKVWWWCDAARKKELVAKERRGKLQLLRQDNAKSDAISSPCQRLHRYCSREDANARTLLARHHSPTSEGPRTINMT